MEINYVHIYTGKNSAPNSQYLSWSQVSDTSILITIVVISPNYYSEDWTIDLSLVSQIHQLKVQTINQIANGLPRDIYYTHP